MIWVSLILGIIQAIPSILKIIQEIVDLIHGHPAQAFHEHAFLGILAAWRDHRDPVKLEADLQAIHARLAR